MIDGGRGGLNDAIENLYSNYELACIMEDIQDLISKERFSSLITKGYEYHMKTRKSRAIEYSMGFREEKDYMSKCILHSINDEPFLWLEIHSGEGEDVEFYIVRKVEEE